MLRFTLDTNCIVDIEEGREAAPIIRQLVSAHADGRADVALVAISASERQKGQPIENFNEFRQRLERLRLDGLPLLMPILYFDVTFWDWSLWADNGPMVALEQNIHDVLFPGHHFLFSDLSSSLPSDADRLHIESTKWRNRKCDALALWSHIHAGREVFVTRDGNFHKASKLPLLVALGAGRIETPGTALALVNTSDQH